jgi:hypothetical protein
MPRRASRRAQRSRSHSRPPSPGGAHCTVADPPNVLRPSPSQPSGGSGENPAVGGPRPATGSRQRGCRRPTCRQARSYRDRRARGGPAGWASAQGGRSRPPRRPAAAAARRVESREAAARAPSTPARGRRSAAAAPLAPPLPRARGAAAPPSPSPPQRARRARRRRSGTRPWAGSPPRRAPAARSSSSSTPRRRRRPTGLPPTSCRATSPSSWTATRATRPPAGGPRRRDTRRVWRHCGGPSRRAGASASRRSRCTPSARCTGGVGVGWGCGGARRAQRGPPSWEGACPGGSAAGCKLRSGSRAALAPPAHAPRPQTLTLQRPTNLITHPGELGARRGRGRVPYGPLRARARGPAGRPARRGRAPALRRRPRAAAGRAAAADSAVRSWGGVGRGGVHEVFAAASAGVHTRAGRQQRRCTPASPHFRLLPCLPPAVLRA